MWGKKNTEAMSPLDATLGCEMGWLGSSLHVKGEITGTEDLQIDGSVEGLIHLDERKLTVGTTAKVTADIEARDVVVPGSLRKVAYDPLQRIGVGLSRLGTSRATALGAYAFALSALDAR